MRPLPTGPVLSRLEIRTCGWTDPGLTRAARSGRVIRLRRGQFSAPPAPTEAAAAHRLLAIAAVRSCTGSAVSHRSATVLYGLPLLAGPPPQPDLTVPPEGTGDHRGAHLHRATLRPEDVVLVDGVPVTSPARTVLDLARSLPMEAAVVTADAALQRGLVSPAELVATAEGCGRWPGIRRARRVLKLVDGRAESPLESISRLAIARLDVPTPELQPVIRSIEGYALGRLDFYFDDVGAAGEADGREKYSDRDVLWAEKKRQEDLEDPGVAVTRWGWATVRRPWVLETRLRSARERGRRRDESGFPRLWSVQLTPPLTVPL